jgi:hypothetical protein
MVDTLDVVEPESIAWPWFPVPYPYNDDTIENINLSLEELHVNIATALNYIDIDIATKAHVMICILNYKGTSGMLINSKKEQSTVDLEFTVDDVNILMLLISSIGFASIGIPVSYNACKLIEKAQKLFHTKAIIDGLLKEFKDYDIRVFSNLEVDGLESIDIFVCFPQYKFFLLSLQPIGRNVVYHSLDPELVDSKDGLFIKAMNGNGRRKRFMRKGLALMPDQEKFFRRQYKDIMGGTGRSAKTGIIKILVICGAEARIDPCYPKILIKKIEGKNFCRKFCLAQVKPILFMIHENDVKDFIKAKLLETKPTSKA